MYMCVLLVCVCMCVHTHAHDIYIQGGVYDGDWKQGLKDGFGCYKVFSKKNYSLTRVLSDREFASNTL
jgi:hypothetical protein